MIIIDIQQIIYANVMVMVYKEKDTELTEGIVRHMTLNSIRLIKNQFGEKYGEVVIACDNKSSYWRRDRFPYYKANRKSAKEKQTAVDWNFLNQSINTIVQELHDNFSYRVINVEGAEADDIIASLCIRYANDMGRRIMIISRDHDFHQLHGNMNVEQYDWMKRSFITCDNPDLTLKEHIIKGDNGDGIPNILSVDTSFVMKIRQKTMTQQRLEMYMGSDFNKIENAEIKRNIDRNKMLIDFSNIPDEIHERILSSFDKQENKTNKNLFNYFMEKRLKELMGIIGDFT